jgi:RNA polymerase sigma factor (sigma-70 family)
MPDPSLPPNDLVEHAAFVRRLAFHLLHDDANADDAAQETLARAITTPPCRGPGFRSWLAAVLTNVVRRGHRQHARIERREHAAARPESTRGTADVAARDEILAAVTDAVRWLDAPHREVVLLRHYEGLPPREIATKLGVPVATVKSRLARAHDQLRRRLNERGGGNVEGWRSALLVLVGPDFGRAMPVGSSAGESAGTATASGAKGAIAMTMGSKSALVAAAVVLVALALWKTGAFDGDSSSSRGASSDSSVARAANTTADADANQSNGATLAARPTASSPTAAAISGPSISGRVVDHGGKPIAGARVVSIPDTNTKTFSADDIGKPDCPAVGATAGPDGRFVIAVTKDAPFHILFANAPGFAFSWAVDVAPGADVTLTLEPSLTLVGTVRDRDGAPVVGARVRALWLVDAMRIEREAHSGEGGAYRVEGLVSFPTEQGISRGTFTSARIETTADGFAPLFVSHSMSGVGLTESREDLVLSRGVRLAGRVVAADGGAPVESATVVLCLTAGAMGFGRANNTSIRYPYSPRALGETRSAKDGSFVFEHVPPGTGSQIRGLGSVAAWATGRCADIAEIPWRPDGTAIDVTLSLWPAATVTGRILEADGTAASGALLSAKVDGRDPRHYLPNELYPTLPAERATADADGRFRLEAVRASAAAPTDVKILVTGPDRPDRIRPTVDEMNAISNGDGWSAASRATVKAGETTDIGDIVLPSAAALASTTVFVTTPNGEPVFGARFGSYGRTSTDGRLVFRGLATRPDRPAVSRRLLVRAHGFAPTLAAVLPPGTGPDPQIIVLSPGHRIAGRVLGADGSPATDAEVFVGDGTMPAESVFPPDQFAYASDIVPEVRSLPVVYAYKLADADGRFVIDDLPAGPHHILALRKRRIYTTGSVWLRAPVQTVPTDATDLVLALPAEDSRSVGTVTGSVLDAATSKPLTEFSVVLGDGDTAVRSLGGGYPAPPGWGEADSTGGFRFTNVPVGTYRVRIRVPGYRPYVVDRVEVAADATTTVPPISLDHGAAVSGRLRGPAAESYERRQLLFYPATPTGIPRGEAAVWTHIERDGSFRAMGFSPGTYLLMVPTPIGASMEERPTYLPAAGERLVVRDGDTDVRLDVAIAAAGMLTVQPSDERLPPPPWLRDAKTTREQAKFGAATRVTIRGPDGALISDQTGVARDNAGPDSRPYLLPGRYVARMEMSDGTTAEEAVDVVAGKYTNVTFAKK